MDFDRPVCVPDVQDGCRPRVAKLRGRLLLWRDRAHRDAEVLEVVGVEEAECSGVPLNLGTRQPVRVHVARDVIVLDLAASFLVRVVLPDVQFTQEGVEGSAPCEVDDGEGPGRRR